MTRLLAILATLLGLRASAQACDVWNASPEKLIVGSGKWEADVQPFDHKAYDGGLQRVHADRPGAMVKKISCGGRDVIQVRFAGEQPVIAKLPRSIQVALDRDTKAITVTGPKRRLAVQIAGVAITADAKGRFVAVPDLRQALLAAEIGRVASLFPYGDVLVPVVASAGKDHLEVEVEVGAGHAFDQLEDEVQGISAAPLSWGAALGPVPHPALYLRPGLSSETRRLTPLNRLQHLGEVQIVALATLGPEVERVLETCRYDSLDGGGATVKRLRDVLTVTVYEATTGKQLGNQDFRGGDPPPCPERVTLGKWSSGTEVRGTMVDDDVAKWLATQ